MSTAVRRDWLEQIADAAIAFDWAMRRHWRSPEARRSAPRFESAQTQLRNAVKRLDPKRATLGRLERVCELALEMLEARVEDGPAVLPEDVADAVLDISDLERSRPEDKPELADLDAPSALAALDLGPRSRPSSLAADERSL